MRIEKIIYSLGIVALMASCSGSKSDDGSSVAHDLSEDVMSLVRSYTDSMKVARDSARIQQLSERFEERIVKLNYQYPPNTDLKISESANDTIAMLMAKYVKTRAERLKKLSNKQDSVPSSQDSVTSLPEKVHLATGAVK